MRAALHRHPLSIARPKGTSFLSFALLSILVYPTSARAQLQPTCPLPFRDIQLHHPIDDACGAEGNGSEPTLIAQNRAKNNFCVAGSPVDLTIRDFANLQRAAEASGVLFGNASRLPTKRDQLLGIYGMASGQRVGEGSLVRVTGYMVDSHYSNVISGESVNCKISGQENNDFDVHLAATPADDLCQSVVAEVSPHFRPSAWTPHTLTQLADHAFRLTGHLFFDASHKPCANGVVRGGPARISLWEIHPVYGIEVCGSTPGACDAGNGWVPLDQFLMRAETAISKTTTRNQAATTFIVVNAPKVVPTGSKTDVEIALQDASGKPVAAGQDLAINVQAQGANSATKGVTIRKGQQNAKLNFDFNQPGSVELRAEPPAGVANISAGSAPPISVGAATERDVTPPLTIKYWISPQPLYAGGEGMLVAQLINGDGRALITTNNIEISFAGLQAELRPNKLSIESGNTSGSVRISYGFPLSQTVHPVLGQNAQVREETISSSDLKVEFQSRITGVRVLAPQQMPHFLRTEIPLTVELFDVEGNQAASDKKRTVMLSSDHPDIGDLRDKEIVFSANDPIPKKTRYSPNREGRVTIHALSAAGDLREIPGEIEFVRVWWYFALVAASGGTLGGFLRWYRKRPGRIGDVVIYLVLGVLTGLVAYYVLGSLLGKLLVLQDSGMEIRIANALVWGVIGGILGPHLLAERVTKLIMKE